MLHSQFMGIVLKYRSIYLDSATVLANSEITFVPLL